MLKVLIHLTEFGFCIIYKAVDLGLKLCTKLCRRLVKLAVLFFQISAYHIHKRIFKIYVFLLHQIKLIAIFAVVQLAVCDCRADDKTAVCDFFNPDIFAVFVLAQRFEVKLHLTRFHNSRRQIEFQHRIGNLFRVKSGTCAVGRMKLQSKIKSAVIAVVKNNCHTGCIVLARIQLER